MTKRTFDALGVNEQRDESPKHNATEANVKNNQSETPFLDSFFSDTENLNYAGSDLSGFDFSGMDLENANFEGANLRGANFTEAQFNKKTKFKDADLTNAVFNNIWLNNCANILNDRKDQHPLTLSDCDIYMNKRDSITNITLENSSVTFDNARNIRFENVTFIDSRMKESDTASNTVFDHCSFTNTYAPHGETIDDSTFDHCIFQDYERKFSNTFRRVTFIDCDLTCEEAFAYATFKDCTIDGQATQLSPEILANMIVTGHVNINDCNLEDIDLSGKDLSNINFERVNLSRAKFSDTELSKCQFITCGFSADTTFDRARIDSCFFDANDLSRVSFKQTTGRKSSIRDCTLNHTDFSGSQHRILTVENEQNFIDNTGINFSGSTLKQPLFINFHTNQANFESAEIQKLILTNAYFIESNFKGAIIVSFDQDNSAEEENAVPNFPFEQTDAPSAPNIDISFRGSDFTGATIKSFLTQDMLGSKIIDFSGTNFTEANLRNVFFSDIIAKGANFSGADWRHGKISTFTGRHFLNAHQDHPRYDEADLPILTGTNMVGFKFDEDEEKAFAEAQGAVLVSQIKRANPQAGGYRQRLAAERQNQSEWQLG